MPIGKEDDAPGPIDMPRGNAREVLAVFLRLGLTSFGGPIAHLGYFHDEFVVRRRWLDEKTYADLVALCQFLPGPASSQVGIAIGLSRAGYLGSLAAWLGFTLPSAVALVLFALVGGTLLKVLLTNQRAFDTQTQTVDLQENLRDAAAILPNELRELGMTLKAGEVVTTGTCHAPLPIQSGDVFDADFGLIGRVSVAFK